MKMVIDKVLNPEAAGPARMNCAIVPGAKGPRDATPGGVAVLAMGEGQTVRMMLSAVEAREFGAMLITCGCLAEGGMPPVAEVEASPLIIHEGGRA